MDDVDEIKDAVDEMAHGAFPGIEAFVNEVAKDDTPKKETLKKEKLPYSVYVVVIALIIDLLGFTLILPLMPSILDHYRANDKDGLYGWLEKQVDTFQTYFEIPENFSGVLFGGLLGSIFSCLQFLFSPIIGALSDVYGRKPVLIATMIGVTFSNAVWSLSQHFYMFVIARIIGGISRGNISLSAAIVTDLCSPKLRGKGMALIGIAFSIAFIVGPVIGAVLFVRTMGKSYSVSPALLACGLGCLDVLFLLVCFKESLPPKKRANSVTTGLADAFSYINPFSLFSFKPVKHINSEDLVFLQRIGWIYFHYLFLYSGLEFTLSFLTHERFAYSSVDQGYMYLFSGIIMTIIQGTYLRKVEPGTELSVALSGTLATIPSFVIIGLSQSTGLLYAGLILYAYASATVVPCYSTFISKLGSDNQKGTTMGTFRSLGYLARGLGPFVSALGYWCLGSRLCYCLGSILLILPLSALRKLCSDLARRSVHEKTH